MTRRGLVSPAVTALVNIGSTRGSARGTTLYGCCFSIVEVFADGLEFPDWAGASWVCFLRLELVPLLHVVTECPRTQHYL